MYNVFECLSQDLAEFINITTIGDQNDHKNQMNKFEEKLKIFFTKVSKSFLK